jgi:hypothetical protein
MFRTRIQTTDNRIGDEKFTGPPEAVPVHPLGNAVFAHMNDDTKYIIKAEDGSVYEWWIAVYVNEKKGYTADCRQCVTRTKGDCITTWEEPSTLSQLIDNKPYGIYAQYNNDGSIVMRYSSSGETYYYSPKNKCVNPIQGLQSISTNFGETRTVDYPTPLYKMMNYQILVFENQELYDSDVVSADKAVDVYIKMCMKYLNPKYIPQENIVFESDERFVKYNDRSGGHKPMMILMTGVFTPEMIRSIKDGLKEMYVKQCIKYD